MNKVGWHSTMVLLDLYNHRTEKKKEGKKERGWRREEGGKERKRGMKEQRKQASKQRKNV